MDMYNSVGLDCGSRGWGGWKKEKGEKWDNCNRITMKKKKEKKGLL